MKSSDLQKLKDLTVDELAKRESELKEELYHLRFQNHTGQLENPMRLRLSRRMLARVKTIIRQKTSGAPTGKHPEGK